MSDDVSSSGVSSTTAASTTAASSSSTAAKSAAATTSTHISTMEDLKNKAPEVYNLTLKSLATQIINKMKADQDHLKETMRRGYQK